MQPLQISAETAIKLAKQLGVPVEHIMHMPKHILLEKLSQLANTDDASKTGKTDSTENKDS